jgi:hypothetical protein
MILNYFDVLVSKINFKNKKYIILIYFSNKNILKNNRYHNKKYRNEWIYLFVVETGQQLSNTSSSSNFHLFPGAPVKVDGSAKTLIN